MYRLLSGELWKRLSDDALRVDEPVSAPPVRLAASGPLAMVLGLLAALFWSMWALTLRWENGTAQAMPNHRMASALNYLPLVTHVGSGDSPLPVARPSWSAPVAVSSRDHSVWVVNPDSSSVTVLREGGTEKVMEIDVGGEPSALAIPPDGRTVYIIDRANGTLVAVDAVALRVHEVVAIGPEPAGIALSPTGARAYVTLSTANQVVVLDTSAMRVTARLPVAPAPYAIAVTNDGDAQDEDEQIYITHLLAFPKADGKEATDDGREGRVSVMEACSHTITGTILLAPDEHGFPNLLSGIALSAEHAWVPQVQAAPALPNGLTTTVFASISVLDLDAQIEAQTSRLHLNDLDHFGSPVNNPVAAVPAPDGKRLYIVLAGSDLVEVVDVSMPGQPGLVTFLRVGRNPRGLALTADGRRGYVMNYLSRSITVLDLDRLAPVAEIAVTGEPLEPEVLRGKILFHNASDPRLSRGSWVSCASCHPDSGTDGVTWRFPDGPRQSPPLWNAAQTLPWHWSAALDEPQDVEETVQVIQHGWGLAPGADPPQLGPPNGGRSADLDALAAFLVSGIRAPTIPPPPPEASEGRAIFEAAGCTACHGGPTWTASKLPGVPGTLDPDGNGMIDPVLRNVGTLNPLDVRGAEGFDPPSLLLAGLTPPYLHDGSMATLETLLASGHPNPQGTGNGLDDEEIVALAAFLRSIGPETPAIDIP